MLDNLKKEVEASRHFLTFRWDNPLHADLPTDMQGRMWPSSEDFYHPLNAMFSCFFQTQEHLEYFKVVLLRDGAHMLLDFFLRFPSPKGNVATFLVPADLLFLVPDAWRAKVLAYRMENPRPFKQTKRLVFCSMVSDTCLSWQHFKHHMPKWLERFPKDATLSAYIASRNEPFDHTWTDKKISFEFMSIFQNYFKNAPELLTFLDFKAMCSKTDITYINTDLYFGGVSLCAVDNLVYSQSAQTQPRTRYPGFKGKKIGEWPMSFKHNLTIYTAECEDSDFSPFLFHKKTSLNKKASLPYPIIPALLELLVERLRLPEEL
ncbi:MAG: hypothetical protein K2P81_13600 [Bacteriovoracaceae bacterium]|nr:hypothetical protein [Bacteriovoracaceae bacterium]